MTLSTVLLVLAGVLVSSLLANGGLLWFAAKALRVPRISFLRVLITVLVVWPASVFLFAPWVDGNTGLALLSLGIFALLAFFTVRWGLRCGFGKTIASLALWLVTSLGFSLFLATLVRLALLDTFIVPTGAMAPTILGTHVGFGCENCGWRIALAVPMDPRGFQRVPFERFPERLDCGNCGAAQETPRFSGTERGDKICVDKTVRPRRWDLAVFRVPWEPKTMYVKRLIGLPGETVEIVEGDIFVDGIRLSKPPGVAEELWFPVHDTRYRPREATGNGRGWRPETAGNGWELTSSGWVFLGGEGEGRLAFAGAITDRFSYNWPLGRDLKVGFVRDVKVDCHLGSFSGEGTLAIEWTKGEQRVLAELAAPGNVRLQTDDDAVTGELGKPLSGSTRVAFALRDGQAFITAAGKTIVSLHVLPAERDAIVLTERSDTCRVSLLAADCRLSLTRILLKRDVHYVGYRRPMSSRGSGKPFFLRAGEHYLLGDNTQTSFDSRGWTQTDPQERNQPGTVGLEHMLGSVRMVFWPPSSWRYFKPGSP